MEKMPYVNLPLSELVNHPKNIRTRYDSAEIEELADSIRCIGVLQPLVVVPAPGREQSLDLFYVVAGNRRLLAAKEAHLYEVPCTVIMDLSEKEQATMMITENMQRKNLTPYEEGKAFQYLLDLGDSITDISRQTGLSSGTIRSRIEVGKLDQKLVEARLASDQDNLYQLSLFDLERLRKIESISKRNAILKVARSSENLAWLVEQELRDEARSAIKTAVTHVLAGEKCKPAGSHEDMYGPGVKCVTVPLDPRDPDGTKAKATKAIEDAKESGLRRIRYQITSEGLELYGQDKAKKADRVESEENRKKAEEAKAANRLARGILEVAGHLQDAILDIAAGKLFQKALPEPEEKLRIYEGVTRILLTQRHDNGSLFTSLREIDNYTQRLHSGFDYSADAEKRLEKLKSAPPHILWLLAAGRDIGVLADANQLTAFGRTYEAARMRPVWTLLGLIKPYGVELTPEDEDLIYGRSELYSNPLPADDDGSDINDFEATRAARGQTGGRSWTH